MRLLLDENLEKALLLGLRRRHPGVDVVRVVDGGLGGRSDPENLEWAAKEGRVVVSRDRATLSAEAVQRIEAGKPMPGLILIRRGVGIGRILEDLELLLATARPGELENAEVILKDYFRLLFQTLIGTVRRPGWQSW